MLLYLPPYFLDFNPIEQTFAKDRGTLAKSGDTLG
jgi:transposase